MYIHVCQPYGNNSEMKAFYKTNVLQLWKQVCHKCFVLEPNLKLKMRVQLMNAAGLDEAGIDGGGIFREFLSELLKTGFDPNRGLFLMTTDRLLYPNPQSVSLMDNYTKHYYFLGRMLGKVCLYQFIVVNKFSGKFTW